MIAPVVRRFVDLRESIDYRVGILRRNSPFAAHLEIAADRRELEELSLIAASPANLSRWSASAANQIKSTFGLSDMKKLFIAAITSASLLLAAAPASATNIAYGKNSVGRVYRLDDDARRLSGRDELRVWHLSTGEVGLTGCWRYNEPVVSVDWRESAETRQYKTATSRLPSEWKR